MFNNLKNMTTSSMASTSSSAHKSHPLEISSDDEDSDYNDDSRTSPVDMDDSSKKYLIGAAGGIAGNNEKSDVYEAAILKLNSMINQIPPIAPKREKRQAPKIPDVKPVVNQNKKSNLASSDEEKFTNFHIYIDQVRWFYKGDKKSSSSTTNKSSSSNNISANNNQANNALNAASSTNLNSLENNLVTFNLNNDNESIGDLSSDINNNRDSKNITNANNNNVFNTNRQHIHNVSSKKWYMFNKYDSYNLECEYRDMITKRNLNLPSNTPKTVQVLENLYEVDLETNKCYSIYWKIKRCIWFTDSGEPLDEKTSEEIEAKHVELFRDILMKPSNDVVSISSDYVSMNSNDIQHIQADHDEVVKPSSSDLAPKPVGSLQVDGGTVTWYSKDETYMEKSKMGLIDMVTLGFTKFRNKISGVRIRRGYRDTNKDESSKKPKEITHLIFVVHGIAQKLYENSIYKNCDELRKECEKKKKEFFPSHEDQQFDWRSSLVLDDGIVETITPKSIQTIRDKINSSVLDIMYYTSPVFRSEIMNSLSSELNRLYKLFCSKNPMFKLKHNKVSFVAHSLGTVIMYDILTSNNSLTQFSNVYGNDSNQEKLYFSHLSPHNNSANKNDHQSNLIDEYQRCKARMQEIESTLIHSNDTNLTCLDFRIENMFNLGSPLALFLALRGVRPAGIGSQEHILPKHLCKRLFNLYHPSDAIAYRIEPLILKHYSTKAPIDLQKSSDAVTKISYKELNEKRSALNVDLKSALSKIKKDKKKDKDAKSAELNQMKEEVQYCYSNETLKSKNQIDQVELEAALDYRLQDSNFESLAVLNAHFTYWTSPETALFIMQQLCIYDNDKKL